MICTCSHWLGARRWGAYTYLILSSRTEELNIGFSKGVVQCDESKVERVGGTKFRRDTRQCPGQEEGSTYLVCCPTGC